MRLQAIMSENYCRSVENLDVVFVYVELMQMARCLYNHISNLSDIIYFFKTLCL